jgi:hypothetical protein
VQNQCRRSSCCSGISRSKRVHCGRAASGLAEPLVFMNTYLKPKTSGTPKH